MRAVPGTVQQGKNEASQGAGGPCSQDSTLLSSSTPRTNPDALVLEETGSSQVP